jgi:hypothetical protein
MRHGEARELQARSSLSRPQALRAHLFSVHERSILGFAPPFSASLAATKKRAFPNDSGRQLRPQSVESFLDRFAPIEDRRCQFRRAPSNSRRVQGDDYSRCLVERVRPIQRLVRCRLDVYGLSFDRPVLASVDLWSFALSAGAAVTIFTFRLGMLQTLAACCGIGMGLYLAGAI